jgi:hypothetical protein
MSLTRSRAFHLLGIQLSTSREVSFRGYITSSVKEQVCPVVDNQFDVLVCGRETVQSAVYVKPPKRRKLDVITALLLISICGSSPITAYTAALDSWSRSFS